MVVLQRAPCTNLYGRSLAAPQQCSTAGPSGAAFRPVRRHARATPTDGRVRAAAADVAEQEEMSDEKRDIQKMLSRPYKYGFKTMIESDVFPKGLSEDVVRAISAKKDEPEWLLEFRSVEVTTV